MLNFEELEEETTVSNSNNYSSLISGSNTQDWISYMSKSYINLTSPEFSVFKMDKVATQLDDLYGESKQGRIYLPPFKIRGMYDNNKWIGFLDTGGFAEKEEVMTVFLNLQEMVEMIKNLRNKHIAEIYITYNGTGTPSMEKTDNLLNIYINGTLSITFDLSLSQYSTIRKFATELDNLTDWSCIIKGKNDLSKNLINFSLMGFNQRELMIYTIDDTYKNITDVIEIGDAVLTNRYRLYEVTASLPAGDFGWDYSLWKLSLELASPDRFNLPGNYIELIKNTNHGLDKVDME